MGSSASSKHTEVRFEDAIEQVLLSDGGYERGNPNDFDAELGLFPDEVVAFVQATQPKPWQALADFHGDNADEALIDALVKALASKGALNVLRYGFKCFGKGFRLAWFMPNTGMNPEALADYEQNRLRVYRQVHHSPKNPALSIDCVLAINGLPVVTAELKNPMTGQTVAHAQKQYRNDRDPREPIFRFDKGKHPQRSLVHFAVDPDQVFMTTRLLGESTYFLPFNRGHEFGAGNPPAAPGEYRTSYLWNAVLARGSLMDILGRFMHLEVTEKKVVTNKGVKKLRKETLIFPRYHQLDAVRRLIRSARQQGSGHNYLIQHSAGSGKSNSIAWLAHRLSSLHDAADKKVFDTVVVITDRRVLDQQLQDTIYQFEHKQGVVEKIDENTQQLAKALAGGTPIIVSTIQKFPFIAQAIDTLDNKGETVELDTAGKRFAVIVDEAHSSQSGETAMELKRVLNQSGIAEVIADQFDDEPDDALSEQAKANLLANMLKRPRQPNISFFAFTATPKFKTLAVFNEPGDNGRPPFHLYAMRQAIEERFIFDVLANYTTYKTYYGLIRQIEDDPDVPQKKAARALARFMGLHPHNIAQKVEVIVEHFRAHTRHKIGGRAKAMVVTGSRLHAVRYKLAFDQYIANHGYEGIRSLVAFSGTVQDPDTDQSFTEPGMNAGIKESELPEAFDGEGYQVLLVADKYQTGFDQPLLHTMYVDKRLAGVQAVQTLSRLNRTAQGKNDTFVLDFYNEADEIYAAFKPYYELTASGEASDPHQLYDLQHRMDEAQAYEQSEIDAFCDIWFGNRSEPTPGEHQRLNQLLEHAVDRFKTLDEEQQKLFKGRLVSFIRLYAFLSQIIPYQDSDLEKFYTYGRYLLRVLPRRTDDDTFELDGEVDLKYYRLQKISEGSIDLGTGESEPLEGPKEVGIGDERAQYVALSSLVDRLNERFGTDFTPADQLFFEQVTQAAVEKSELQAAAQVNSRENFSYVFDRSLERLLIERMEGNEEIFVRMMNDKSFRDLASAEIMQAVYERLRRSGERRTGSASD